MNRDYTITAISTPMGAGAIAVIRLSGTEAINICEKVFTPSKKGEKLLKQSAYTIHRGLIVDGKKVVDDVLVSLFKAPNSYTGEDVVEISCHGSMLIQQQILELLIRNGATLAEPGEFTLRAFLNGKMDLTQAEGVADLIAANSEAAKRVAIEQMRGGFSDKLKNLREKLLHFISLIELELDFSEEDVEFANRQELHSLIESIGKHINQLIESFQLGNVIKNGIPVTIAGKPNVGKSTLLNHLLNEERAIVSEIEGTTRDSIEDVIHINGMLYRFIDTAGLRHTTDTIESLGIERAYIKISQALVILLLIDSRDSIDENIREIKRISSKLKANQKMLVLINKIDLAEPNHVSELKQALSKTLPSISLIEISAKHGVNMDKLTNAIIKNSTSITSEGDNTIITNTRHYEALIKAYENLIRVKNGLKNDLPQDLLAMDIRQVIHYIGEITGEITTDEILGSIFSKFCIGK
jgi:tRNA modification GTPase